MATVGLRSICALSLTLVLPGVAAARVAPARPGVSTRGGGIALNGCKARNPNFLRIPLKTTNRMHQPFLTYDGQLVAPGGQSAAWQMLIDRCGATPKVIIAGGGIPAFSCPSNPSSAFFGYNNAGFAFWGHELAIRSGRFSASGLTAGQGNPDVYSLTGAVTGSVTIPKHGRGKGASTITGTVTDESYCPSTPLTYKVKFVRTWAYV